MDENNSVDICRCTVIHDEAVKRAKEKMMDDEVLYDLAEFFKVYGDSTRIKILNVLFHEELCVCDIAAILGTSQSAVSHQLKILRQAKVVKVRKDGKVVYYSLDDEHIKDIFDQGIRHISEK